MAPHGAPRVAETGWRRFATDARTGWVAVHRRNLMIGVGAVTGLVLLVWSPLTGGVVLVVALVAGALLAVIAAVASQAAPASPAPPGPRVQRAA